MTRPRHFAWDLRPTRAVANRTDHIMQWSYRYSCGYNPPSRDQEKTREEWIFVLIGNIAAAFDGERLFLARSA